MSSLDTNALLKAAGLGIAVTIVTTVCGYAANFAVGITPGTVPDPNSLPAGYTMFTFCLGCVGYLLYVVFGASYGFFARQNGTPIEVGSTALGGAAAGLATALVSSVLGVISLLISGPAMMSAFEQSGLDFTGGVAAAGIIGGLIGLCIGVVITVALAAAGGAIYAAITGRSEQQAV